MIIQDLSLGHVSFLLEPRQFSHMRLEVGMSFFLKLRVMSQDPCVISANLAKPRHCVITFLLSKEKPIKLCEYRADIRTEMESQSSDTRPVQLDDPSVRFRGGS